MCHVYFILYLHNVINIFYRYCQQILNETVRTSKLTPIAATLQEVEGRVDEHVIPKEVTERGLALHFINIGSNVRKDGNIL